MLVRYSCISIFVRVLRKTYLHAGEISFMCVGLANVLENMPLREELKGRESGGL